MRRALARVAWLIPLLASACAERHYLVATPNLLQIRGGEQTFIHTPATQQQPDIPVLFATDRDRQYETGKEGYGYGRSKRLAFGVATVQFSPQPTWDDFVRDSLASRRSKEYELKLAKVTEVGAFEMWSRLQLTGETFQLTPDALGNLQEQRRRFQSLLSERLAQSASKDVYLFVHGFNNTFEEGVFRVGQLWHFLGRTGVPIAYSWPAGFGGIRGYAYDRESGEFTVFHLKQFIRSLAANPDVERIHLIAHSRGTDVLISALRELHISMRAQNLSTQETFKIENLILAAPDLDEDVFIQRFVAENLLTAARRTTIYASQNDRAIRFSDLVFASKKRLGQLGPRDFHPKVREALAALPNLQFIECNVTGYSSSHSYVFGHPAALSDLILVLRDRRPPGAEYGRPLDQSAKGVWQLTNDYLLAQSKRARPEALAPARPTDVVPAAEFAPRR
jgi:esterase/lipase superfamily enzyme